jgi:Asp-tRNA(Asn)/Glu-tRNA(Gln) amidotransferase A subunit family amidase
MSDVFNLDTARAVARVRARDPEIRAFINTRLEDAMRDAAQGGSGGSPLAGVPFGLKDEWETTILPTTGGSERHKSRRPEKDSAVYEVFRDAGAILIGKTNLSDMGLAAEAISYVGGATRNPHCMDRTSGGSSGGAAAAVADGMIAFDWGTDIGGSIRLPAAFCGVLGLKLSSETWPMSGSFPVIPKVVEWMCGQGPITRTTRQMRKLLEIAAPRLRTGSARPFSFKGAVMLTPDHLGLWPAFRHDVEPHIERAIGGPVTRSHDIPSTSEMFRTYGGVWSANLENLLEADDSLTFFEGLFAALSATVLRGRLLGDRRFYPTTAELLVLMALGRITLFRDQKAALDAAMRIRDVFAKVWDRGLLVFAPVTTYPPPIIGQSNRNTHLLDCTAPGNMADATGLSIPFGTFGGLPRSIQILGPPGSEELLIEIGERFIASRDADRFARPVEIRS